MCQCGGNNNSNCGCCNKVVITERGLTGPRGERGLTGPQGEQGIQGEQGEQGIPGECFCNTIVVYRNLRVSDATIGVNSFTVLPELSYTVPSGVTDSGYLLQINGEGYFDVNGNLLEMAFKKNGVLIEQIRSILLPNSDSPRIVPFNLIVVETASTGDVFTFEASITNAADTYPQAMNFVITRIS